jgi:DNA-binding response OmpR family regulator
MTNEMILVIDTEESCKFLERVLSPAGYRVITASSPEAGLECTDCEQPDLILLEMNIDGGSGLNLLASMREAGCVAPAILMTSTKSGTFGVEAFCLGIRYSLTKPFTMAQVYQALDQALREIRLVHEHEDLNHNMQTAEAVRMTVVTLSHYLNNNVMAVGGVLTLLEEALHENSSAVDLIEMIQNGKEGLQGIRAVLRVLRQTTEFGVSSYSSSAQMVDIQALLEKELRKVHKNTQTLGNRID